MGTGRWLACAGSSRSRRTRGLRRINGPLLPSRRMNRRAANFVAGAVGGLVVAVVAAVLIATGAIDSGNTTTVIQRQAPLASTSSSSDAAERTSSLSVGDIYKKAAPGVAFIQAT